MQNLINDYNSGLSLRKLSEKYNLSAMTIRKKLIQLGVDTGCRIPELNDPKKFEQLILGGMNYKQIAKKFGITKRTVFNKCCKMLKDNEFIFISKDYLLELYKDGIDNITKRFGCDLDVVVKNLEYYKIIEVESIEVPNKYYSNWKEEFESPEQCYGWLIKYGFKSLKFRRDKLNIGLRMLSEIKPCLDANIRNVSIMNFIKHFNKHYWCSTHKQYNCVADAFEDGNKHILRKAIELMWRDENKCNIYRLLAVIARHFKDFTTVSVFKPWVAAFIYDKYLPNGGTIIDPCMGWGGRLLGTFNKNIKYIGYDLNPNAVNAHIQMYEFIGERFVHKPEFYLADSSKVQWPNGDLLFTSPPYDDTEIYHGLEKQCDDTTPIYENIFSFAGIIAINVPKRHLEKCADIAAEYGKKHIEIHEMKTSSFMGRKKTYEPILIFK